MRRLGREVTALPRAALDLGWLAVAAAPVYSAASAIRAGWAAVGDTGAIAAFTADVPGPHLPLVGMPASLPSVDGELLFHPGPLGFWVLALPTRLLGAPGEGMVVGAAAVSVLSVLAVGLLVRRWPSRLLEALLLLATAAMVASIGGNVLADPFNPALGLAPFLVFLVAVVGVVAGHHRQLWVAVLAGSFAAQLHSGYVPLVGVLVVLAAAAIGRDAVRARGDLRRRLTRHVIPIAVGLGVLAWVGPLLDQVGGYGNLARVVRSGSNSHVDTLGLDHGLDLLVSMTTIPPAWAVERAESGSPPPARDAVDTALAAGAVAAVAVLTARAARRRQRIDLAVGVVALTGVAVATFASSRVYVGLFSENLLFYRYFWWPVGALFGTALVFGLVSLALDRRSAGAARGRSGAGRPVMIACAGLAAVAVVVTVAARQGSEPAVWDILAADLVHAETLGAAEDPPGSVALAFAPFEEQPPGWWSLALTLVGQLRLHGMDVRLAPGDLGDATPLIAYRDEHPTDGSEDVEALFVVGPLVAQPPPPGFELASRLPPEGEGGDAVLGVPSALFVADGP
jgi:hypothetical protein